VTKLEPLTRTSGSSTTALTWSHPQYPAVVTNDNRPAHYVPEWRLNSTNANAPTIFYLNGNIENPFSNGDCVAAFDGSTLKCLDVYVWNSDDQVKSLVCSQDINGGDGMSSSAPFFQVWRSNTQVIEPMYISSYSKRNGNGQVTETDSSETTRIDGGATAGDYANVVLTTAEKTYKIYKRGELVEAVTGMLSYNVNGEDSTLYDVTYYVDEQSGIASFSKKYNGAPNESNPSVNAGSLLTSLTTARIDMPMKSFHVTHSDTSSLQLSDQSVSQSCGVVDGKMPGQ
jgi:hypothetical protein